MVSLQPMGPKAWEAWRAASIRDYGAEKVRAGAWPPETADARAATEFARLLPDGRLTPGHEFRSIVTGDGVAAGVLWFAPPRTRSGAAPRSSTTSNPTLRARFPCPGDKCQSGRRRWP